MTGTSEPTSDDHVYVASLAARCRDLIASAASQGPEACLADLRTLVHECEARLGSDHRQSVRMRATLASWAGEWGSPAEAGLQLTVLWHDAARMFGERDADTLLIACNAAAFTGIGGDADGAVEMLETLIGDVEAVFGAGSQAVRTARRNLCVWQARSGVPGGGGGREP
jgi:hypothetical protein